MRTILSALLLSIIITWPITAAPKKNAKTDYIVHYSPFVYINWSTGKLYATGHKRLADVQTNFITSLIRSKVRAMARKQAIKKAQSSLVSTLYNLQFDSQNLVKEKINQNSTLQKRMNDLFSLVVIDTVQVKKDQVSVRLMLPFHNGKNGKKGLYDLLGIANFPMAKIPEITNNKGAHHITGLLLSVQELKNFQPAIKPRIYSRQGRLIYAENLANKKCVREKGMVGYSLSVTHARKQPRLGTKPYLAFVAALKGKGNSDLVLADNDVEAILSSPSGRSALRQCRVVLVPPLGGGLQKPPPSPPTLSSKVQTSVVLDSLLFWDSFSIT